MQPFCESFFAAHGKKSDSDIGTYGERWAPHYDAVFSETGFEVEFLQDLAGEPPRAVELGVGSGRVAIPMAEAGVPVTGIEISDEMLALLAAKPGGDSINVIKGDFADVSVDGRFPLIYLPLNTLFTLLTQERQVECFVNVGHGTRGRRPVRPRRIRSRHRGLGRRTHKDSGSEHLLQRGSRL